MNTVQKLLFLLFVLCHVTVHGGSLIRQLAQSHNKQKIIVSIIEEKHNLLEQLTKEYEDRIHAEQQSDQKTTHTIAAIQNQLVHIEEQLKRNPDSDFLLKKQTLLKESEEIVKDMRRIQEDTDSTIDDLIARLKEFLADTECENFKKKYRLHERLYYSFEDLLVLHELILDQERLIVQLSDQEKTSLVEKESRKRMVTITQEECEKRKHELLYDALLEESIGDNNEEEHEDDLLKIELKVCAYRKQLDERKLEEITYRIMGLEFKLFIAKTQLDLFKKQLTTIKPSIHVSEADVTLAEDELIKEQRNYFTKKDALSQHRENNATLYKNKEKELIALSKQLAIPLGRDVDEWSVKPKQTASAYLSFASIGKLNDELLALAKEKELVDAQILLEELKFSYKKIRTDGKKTYNKIITRGFFTEKDITKEHNEYNAKRRDAEDIIKLDQSKVTAIANLLNQQKRIIDKIRTLRGDADRQADTVFKGKHKDFILCLKKFDEAEEEVKKQVDTLGKITAVYSGVIAEANSIISLIDFICAELQANTIWYRPAYAISLNGIKNVIPDIKAFLHDVYLYITQFNSTLFIMHAHKAFPTIVSIVLYSIILCLLFLIFLFFRRYDTAADLFFTKGQEHTGLIRVISFVIGTVVTFIVKHTISLFIWGSLFLTCWMVGDSYLYILFYVASIFYLLYVARSFMRLLVHLNKEHQYILLPEDYDHRFFYICSFLLYTSIIIFFFRQAFMLSSIYLRSELATILLAINFIVLQISLIFLITKEQIVGIIPEKTDFWLWIRGQVSTYYYLILLTVIAIIVMSNPYVGFGKLVLYVLAGLFYTIVLIKIMFLLHEGVKYASSHLFFYYEESTLRERFAYAKTCFGLIIIASFVILSFIGFIAGAKIWGWKIAFTDVKQWLVRPLLLEDTTHPITTVSLLKIIIYIFSGFAAAYALRQYVLARIFDLLLVESGVQHTVTSIVQYLVIVIAIFIGFKSVGLGELVWFFFTALALSIGLYIKDPISDFIAYFIILVQRPVKIGDLIQIDPTIIGVVRKITPRSVILRKRNSTTIIIPNSHIVNQAIENWNYVRNFVAVGDIYLMIPYQYDPQKVKDVLFQAAESHYNVLRNPRSIVRLSEFTEFGHKFLVRPFISSAHTLERWEIASDIRLLIAKALRENEIEFAIPLYKYVEDKKIYYEQKIEQTEPFGTQGSGPEE